MNYIKYMVNKNRLLNTCGGLIDKYENLDLCWYSCKKDMLDELGKRFDKAKEEISEWKDFDTDYIHIAHNQLHMVAADLLCSGRYHSAGMHLGSNTCAKNLRLVFNKCLDWFQERGELDDEERKEYEETLQYNITHIYY